MQGMKRNSGHDNSAAAATTAVENSTHDSLPRMDATPSEFCAELSKTFRVRSSEVAVLQVCRKGFDLLSAGPDFSLNDLQQLERVTKALAKASFMKGS